jgi:hypothetical protein
MIGTVLSLVMCLQTWGPMEDPGGGPSLGPEPDPAPTEIVELAPPPAVEPEPMAEVAFAPTAEVEPAPAPTEIVELAPPPEDEPAPAGAPPASPVSPARPERPRRPQPPEAGPTLAQSRFGDCGHPGAGLRTGFTLRGHVFTAAWIDRTLHGVIAAQCQSKTYRDVLALDGGTVGIAHFASGSLETLYLEMDVPRYFGRRAAEIPPRPFELTWWREGIRRFLAAPESKAAQQRAWRAYISPSLDAALAHGWTTERELAIAASVGNSLGAYGFQRLAEENGWDPERTLLTYSRMSAHKERRRQRLNLEFPPPRPNA